MADEDLELVVGEMRGYRAWTPGWDDDGNPTLGPLFANAKAAWVPGRQPAARCRPLDAGTTRWVLGAGWSTLEVVPEENSHEAPAPQCMCGYWGYWNTSGPADKVQFDAQNYAPHRITGVIRGSGVVEMHETGFRAEFAELVAVAPPRKWFTDHQLWAQNCWCSVCADPDVSMPYPSVEEVASRYGVPAFASFAAMVDAFPSTHEDEFQPRPELKPLLDWAPLNTAMYSISNLWQPISIAANNAAAGLKNWMPTPPIATPCFSFDTEELTATVAIPATDVVKALQAQQCVSAHTKDKESTSWQISANPSVASKLSPYLTPQPPQSVNRLRPPRQLSPRGNQFPRN